MNRSRIIFVALALGYSALIVFLSAQSNLHPPDIGIQLNDKLLHFVEYLGFSLLWCAAVFHDSPPRLASRKTWGLFVGLFLFAVSDEIHQFFVPGRDADVFDLVADVCGISAGFFAFFKLTNGRER